MNVAIAEEIKIPIVNAIFLNQSHGFITSWQGRYLSIVSSSMKSLVWVIELKYLTPSNRPSSCRTLSNLSISPPSIYMVNNQFHIFDGVNTVLKGGGGPMFASSWLFPDRVTLERSLFSTSMIFASQKRIVNLNYPRYLIVSACNWVFEAPVLVLLALVIHIALHIPETIAREGALPIFVHCMLTTRMFFNCPWQGKGSNSLVANFRSIPTAPNV